ncbi:MAG: helix-turn-helix domain-containing protein [Chloroflexi bacterium]|nr:helix-turn-helix domain-containing protein [Chloroflexota bacterium]
MEKLFLSDREAAEIVGIGRTKLLAEWEAGKLRAVHIGKRRLFPVEEVRAYAARLMEEQGATRA